MSINRLERRRNLTRLSDELKSHAEQLRVSVEPSPAAKKLSSELFLSHSTRERHFAEICDAQCISSKANLALKSREPLPTCSDEVILDTSNYVFLFAAPFRYPNTGCGFLFTRTLEVEHNESGVATPFDSGGLLHHMTRPNPSESVNAFLARHEMPIPEHREYLGLVMTTLFDDPKAYLEGMSPSHPNPIGLTGGDYRQWTHEVRIPEKVYIQGSAHLKAVFAPRSRVADPSVEALLTWCQLEKIDFILFDTPKSDDFQGLQQTCLSYTRRALY